MDQHLKPAMIAVDRLVVEVSAADDGRSGAPSDAVSLHEQCNIHAYVLLGDAGLGKTTVFKQESVATGATFVTARDFLVLRYDRAACADMTFFIDALDEMRAGAQNGHTVLDQIRHKLIYLDVPRFRLSCREADWFGNSD